MLNQDKIKLVSVIALLIIAFSVFYYFIIYLSDQRQKEKETKVAQELYDRKLECAIAGEKYAKELKNELKLASISIHAYIYSESLNRCIINYQFFFYGSSGGFIYSKFIRDVYTKEVLYGYGGREKGAYDIKLQELFFQKELELFRVNYF